MIAWKLKKAHPILSKKKWFPFARETLILQVFFSKNNLKRPNICWMEVASWFWGDPPIHVGIFFPGKNHRNPMSEGQPWEPPIPTHRNSIEGQQLTAAALAAAPPPVGELSCGVKRGVSWELRQWNLGLVVVVVIQDDEREKPGFLSMKLIQFDMDLLGFVGLWTCFFFWEPKTPVNCSMVRVISNLNWRAP